MTGAWDWTAIGWFDVPSDWRMLVCDRHGGPVATFAADNANRRRVFADRLSDAWMASSGGRIIQRMSHEMAGDPNENARAMLLEQPMCCGVDRGRLAKVYYDSGLWCEVYCEQCGGRLPGVGLYAVGKHGKQRVLTLCLDCFVGGAIAFRSGRVKIDGIAVEGIAT